MTRRALRVRRSSSCVRHGVVTRGAVAADRLPGGFAGVYPVLTALEDRAAAAGAAASSRASAARSSRMPGAVDRMRAARRGRDRGGRAWCWPPPIPPIRSARRCPGRSATRAEAGHRAGRKAGRSSSRRRRGCALYVERGGKTLLSYGDDPALLAPAVAALTGTRGARRRVRPHRDRARRRRAGAQLRRSARHSPTRASAARTKGCACGA